ncbi:DNA alkylation repair protein [Oscillospiraceae bacterium HV4-5-C5C]|nr:DNA alkylation repair protein [Oscillospiraceae bacterium HV4-5-C5C]
MQADKIVTNQIQLELRQSCEPAFAAFQARLLPTVKAETIIGVRTPALRKLALELIRQGSAGAFLKVLPHAFFEENQLHALILNQSPDSRLALAEMDRFLPYLDNWATCDQLAPRIFKKQPQPLLPFITTWLTSPETYTLRCAVGLLLRFFLDEHFDPIYLSWVAQIQSAEYYVNRMIAWYFATALAKQYEAAIPYLIERKLSRRTQLMTIQKAVESRCQSPAVKAYLKALRY